MRRAFALLLLFFAIDAAADEKPLVPFDLVKTGVKLLCVRGVSVRDESRQGNRVEYRDGVFRLRIQVRDHTTITVDLDAGVPLRKIVSPGRIDAIALSPSHYLLTIADAGRDFEMTWQPQIGDVPEMAVFTEGNDGLVMILPPAASRLSDVELRFDDPSAEVSPEREGDLVVMTVKFGSPTGRVIASGRISGQEWHDMKRVGEGVCGSR
jgi:hypothetical protein